MKTIRNIITTIISIIATIIMVSCSSEGDILNDMSNANNQVNSEVAAAISCNIYNNVTKASSSEPGGTENATQNTNEEVKSVIFFLMKDDQVLSCKENIDATLYTKKQEGLTVIAVANACDATRQELVKATSRSQIYGQPLRDADLNQLIKIGESEKIEKFEALNEKTVTASAEIEVRQIAARIDLAKLTVNIKASDSKTVKLTSVELKNQNIQGNLKGEFTGFANGSVNTKYGTETILKNNELNKNICRFYTFANDDDNQTTLVLNFEVDNVKSTRAFEIKHLNDGNMVKSGYLYRLNITANVYGENVDPKVTFEVVDWKTSQVSGEMKEGK